MPGQHRKHVPLRSCIACRAKQPKRQLIRIVRTVDGLVEIDPKGKVSGRGAYLCANRSCWDAALQRGRLGQALKCEVDGQVLERLRAFAASLPVEQATNGSGLAPGANDNAEQAIGSDLGLSQRGS